MELPLSLQSVQLLLSFFLGLAYGLFYDFLRGLRSALPVLRHFLDLLFALTFLFGNLLLALYAGNGEYRIFMLLATAFGMILWFLTVSRFFSRIFSAFWSFLTYPLGIFGRFLKKSCKKLLKIAKKLFSRRRKSVTIKERHRKMPKNKGSEGSHGEAQIVTHYQAHHSGSRDLRRCNHRRPSAED